MEQHLLLTIRLQGDSQGGARYHGMAQGAPEWPPSPARVFQALVAGSAAGDGLLPERVPALEWLERLPPPLIAAPRAQKGDRIRLYVPNNDADAVDDPHDVSSIRTEKTVHPTLCDDAPFLYAWTLESDAGHAGTIVRAADDLYQLGRGVDMAWAVGELVDNDTLHSRVQQHGGTIHRPAPGAEGNRLPCPLAGSLASLEARHRATRFSREGTGRSAILLFANAPKPRFISITYQPVRHRVVYELRDPRNNGKMWSWPLHRVAQLVESVRDGAVERLRTALPDKHVAIEQALIGRKADGTNPSPVANRTRIIPLPSIGHAHADLDVRRILLEVPSTSPVNAADVEWAFSGLTKVNPHTGELGPFVLTRTEADIVERHFDGPSRRWRSVTAVALPESAERRRIEPAKKREQAKDAAERIAEEDRAVAAVHSALRHAAVPGTAIVVRVRREPFDARGARVEAFADRPRFAKERLWHVELELDRPVEGPLVIGDGRFLGLGVMAPVTELWSKGLDHSDPRSARRSPQVGLPMHRSGLFSLAMDADARKRDAVGLAHALRRAVMARAQAEIGIAPLGVFFTGHSDPDAKAQGDHTQHLAFQWDGARRRLLIVSPHWLARREPSWTEREAIKVLDRALDKLVELRAGTAGRFAVRRESIDEWDPILISTRHWVSVTPYTVTHHKKRSSPTEVLVADVHVECHRRGLPRPQVTVVDARGVPGRGLEGYLHLDFSVAVHGPVILGRTRHLGGGLFAPNEGLIRPTSVST